MLDASDWHGKMQDRSLRLLEVGRMILRLEDCWKIVEQRCSFATWEGLLLHREGLWGECGRLHGRKNECTLSIHDGHCLTSNLEGNSPTCTEVVLLPSLSCPPLVGLLDVLAAAGLAGV